MHHQHRGQSPQVQLLTGLLVLLTAGAVPGTHTHTIHSETEHLNGPQQHCELKGSVKPVSPGVFSSQLLCGGEQVDAVSEFEECLLLGLVFHALVLLKVLSG